MRLDEDKCDDNFKDNGDLEVLIVASRLKSCVKVRERLYHFKKYKNCFVGSEAVDWLIKHETDPRGDRKEAVVLGEKMFELGLLRHVTNDHNFKDETLFYVFEEKLADFELGSEKDSVEMVEKDKELLAMLNMSNKNAEAKLSALLLKKARKQKTLQNLQSFVKNENQKLEGVLKQLMESRQQIEPKVAALEKAVDELSEEVKSSNILAENINEEVELIQGELESLTQVLFEEVNLMVSTEAKAKHEQLNMSKELHREMERVKQKLEKERRRFYILKTKLNSSGKLIKQKSVPVMSPFISNRRSMSNPRSPAQNTETTPVTKNRSNMFKSSTGSSKALNEILSKASPSPTQSRSNREDDTEDESK